MELDKLKAQWKALDEQLPEDGTDLQAVKELISQHDEKGEGSSLVEPCVEEHSGDGEFLGDGG